MIAMTLAISSPATTRGTTTLTETLKLRVLAPVRVLTGVGEVTGEWDEAICPIEVESRDDLGCDPSRLMEVMT